MGEFYTQQGRYQDALAACTKSGSAGQFSLPGILAGMGKMEEARKVLDEHLRLSEQRYVSPYRIAHMYADLGETDPCFEWLERAFEERDMWVSMIKTRAALTQFDQIPDTHPDGEDELGTVAASHIFHSRVHNHVGGAEERKKTRSLGSQKAYRRAMCAICSQNLGSIPASLL